MIKYIVYCTTNLVNKKIYIGVHKTYSNHFDQYLGNGCFADKPSSYNHPKYAFLYAVLKYGPKNFKRVTIAEFDNELDAFDLEALLVNKEFLKRSDVYNEIEGGNGGDRGLNAIIVYQYSLTGDFIKEYSSYSEAAKSVLRCWSTLKHASKNKHKCADYYWSENKYEKLDLSEFKTESNLIPIFEYDKNGNYNCCYLSVSDAARCNNSYSGNIVRACQLGYLVNEKHFSYSFFETYLKVTIEKYNKSSVYLYSLEGDFIAEYPNCRLAEIAIGAKSGLSAALKTGRLFHNFQWKRTKFDKIPSVVSTRTPHKVGQYDLDGNLVKIYNTVSECKKSYSGAQHVLNGSRKTSGGYTFKYID